MNYNYFFKMVSFIIVVLFSTIITAQTTYTWTGNGNVFSWDNANNWTPTPPGGAGLPLATDNVIIPSGLANDKYPSVFSTLTVNSVTVESGAFIVNSFGANIVGTVTYKLNLPTNNWYLITSPVVGEAVEDLLANHTFATGIVNNSHRGIGTYNNAAPGWTYATATSTGTLNSGVGKSVKLAAAGEISFTGTYNKEDEPVIEITKGNNGFNLIGNPFIAPIFANDNADDNATDLLEVNTDILNEATLWLWNQATNSYDAINNSTPLKSIGVAQSFFVQLKLNTNSADFEFEQGMQGGARGNTFQRKSRPEIKLTINQGKNTKNTDIFYINGTTTGFDNGYDSSVFGGVKTSLQVYTQLVSNNQGKNLAIQSLPNDNFNNAIPVGLIAKGGQEITFSSTVNNLPTGTDVYLEDSLHKKFIKISKEDYKVTLASDVNGVGRFYLHTSSQALSTDDIKQEFANISVYQSSKNQLTITGLRAEKASVKIFSVLGKNVLNKTVNTNGVKTVNLPNLNTGVYLVNIASDLGTITKKVVLK